MPTIQSQGSRAGLITGLVIFVILFITATIFAIYFNVETRKLTEDQLSMKKKYAEIISDGMLADPTSGVSDLKELGKNTESAYNGKKAIEVAMAQRDKLAQTITGKTGEKEQDAVLAARNTLASAAKTLEPAKVPVDPASLTNAVTNLANAIVARDSQIADLQVAVKKAKDENAGLITRTQATVDSREKQIEGIRAEASNTLDGAQKDRSAKQAQITDLEKARDEERKASADAATKLQSTVADKDRQLGDKQKLIDALTAKLASKRSDVNGPIVRQVDGNIVRIPGNAIVYINLGEGDQVTPGLTFQVYDKVEGVPPMGEGMREDNMPIGKGSIEVVRVGATSSECRVVKVTPGTTFSEGDLLVNLIYDPSIKYNFVVHGDFDLDHDGRATPGDAEVIKRLVTQWGAKVVDQVGVDTDFVVLGVEPVLPNFTKDDLQDASKNKIMLDAQSALDTYQEIRQKAKDLHIPVLNQNRFLYYIGYYVQAKK